MKKVGNIISYIQHVVSRPSTCTSDGVSICTRRRSIDLCSSYYDSATTTAHHLYFSSSNMIIEDAFPVLHTVKYHSNWLLVHNM